MDLDTSKLKISKTTAVGVLGLISAVIVAIVALPPKAGAAVVTLAVIKAIIGYLQKDPQ